VTPQYRQVLLNDAGDVVWSCTVWADSEKSKDEADMLMTQFLEDLGFELVDVELLEEA